MASVLNQHDRTKDKSVLFVDKNDKYEEKDPKKTVKQLKKEKLRLKHRVDKQKICRQTVQEASKNLIKELNLTSSLYLTSPLGPTFPLSSFSPSGFSYFFLDFSSLSSPTFSPVISSSPSSLYALVFSFQHRQYSNDQHIPTSLSLIYAFFFSR